MASGELLRTLLLTDLVGSTELTTRLGDRRASEISERHDRVAREILAECNGLEIDKTDGFLLLFERPLDAVRYVQSYHRALAALSQELGVELEARAGIHLGEVILRRNSPADVKRGAKPLEVEGLAKPVAARVMGLAAGRQTLLTRGAFDVARRAAVGTELSEELEWVTHGAYLVKGVDEPLEVFEVGVPGEAPLTPPADSEKAHRADGAAPAATSIGGSSVAAGAPPPAVDLEALADSDIFVTCTAIDDQPLALEEQGWISEFRRKLQVRMEQLSGEQVKVSVALVSETTAPGDPLLPVLHSAKAMIAVVTPAFVKSESCRRVVESFWQAAERSGGVWIGSQPRLFKVVKTPTPEDDVPPGLAALFSQLLGFEFYEEDPQTGGARELDERLGPELRQRYFERVYDVAQEVFRTLSLLKQSGDAAAPRLGRSGKTVYLATSSSDLQPQLDRIRRELVARGHDVLPDRPLPMVAEELEAAVRGYLERADFAVHPVGGKYGVVPEGADESVIELQNRLAAERCAGSDLRRVIWIPKGIEPEEERQASFVRSLKEDPEAHRGAEILQDNLENLKGILLERLAPKPEPARVAEPKTAPRVYLICDQQDQEAIEPLEDYLFEQGLEVSLPDFEADEAEAAEVHRQNLLDCDAVLIFYGSARHAWVDIKLRSLLKAKGYGREEDLAAQAVYVMPPLDRRKERFRTHQADVIVQLEEFQPDLLGDFVQRLKEGAPG